MNLVAVRRALGALVLARAASAGGAESPDYFQDLRGRTYLEVDRSWAARPPGSPEAAPVFRVRELVLRLPQPEPELRNWWAYRKILLVTMASGRRYVAESTNGPLEVRRAGEPRPFTRLAAERRGAVVEVWHRFDTEVADVGIEGDEIRDDDPSRPCSGSLLLTRGGGLELVSHGDDGLTRTVKARRGEIRDAVFRPEEVEELDALRRFDPTKGPDSGGGGLMARIAWAFLFFDRPRPTADLVLEPEPPASDLASWRALAGLPQDLPPFEPGPEGNLVP